MTSDKWGVTSGLPLADADVEIVDLSFGFNNNIGAGIVCANIKFQTEDGEIHDQSFSVGNGWEVGGKGATITGRTKINGSTNWGRFVVSCVEACGGPDKIEELLPAVDYREAAGWIGTKWHLDTEDVESKNPQTGVTKTTSKIIASAFLGAGAPATNGQAKKPAGKSVTSGGKATLADTDPALFAELLELAGNHDDHDSFMQEALQREDVESNPLALTAVMSATKAGSIWQARG